MEKRQEPLQCSVVVGEREGGVGEVERERERERGGGGGRERE